MQRRAMRDRLTPRRLAAVGAGVVSVCLVVAAAAWVLVPRGPSGAVLGDLAAPGGGAVPQPLARDAERAEVVTLINAERKAAGLPALRVDLLLASRANDSSFTCPGGGLTPGRARDIAENIGGGGFASHELSGCPGRTILSVLPTWGYKGFTGEILVYNYESSDVVTYRTGCPPGTSGFDCSGGGAVVRASRTAATAVRQWIDSPSHHDIMLGAFDRFGCGAWAGTGSTEYGAGGVFYACVFSKGGPAKSLDTKAPSISDLSVIAPGAGMAGAGAPVSGAAAGATAGAAAATATAPVTAGTLLTVSSTAVDADTLGRVAAWQISVDGRVVVDTPDAGRVDSGKGFVRLATQLPTAGLAPGAHTVSVRARDMAGRWSAPLTTTITVAP